MKIAWERLDARGLECLDLAIGPTGIRAAGRYVGLEDGVPTAAGHTILLDPAWKVQRVACSWGLGAGRTALELSELREARQRYTRLVGRRYRFEGLDTGFTADLSVDETGVVIDYPGLFQRLV